MVKGASNVKREAKGIIFLFSTHQASLITHDDSTLLAPFVVFLIPVAKKDRTIYPSRLPDPASIVHVLDADRSNEESLGRVLAQPVPLLVF